jgi:hypothetical protein
MTYLLFATAFGLSAIAAYYSIMGLVAIFAAAATPIFIMGSLLEVSKLVVASWLYRSWKQIPKLMMVYFSIALVVLMLLTSMGIFGYLSKAHLDQAVPTGDVAAKLSLIDEKIKTEKENLNANRAELNQLDSQVNETISRSGTSTGANSGTSGVERSIAIRRSQQKDRARILQEIGTTQAKIAKLNEERAPIASEVRKVEAEVGPIKYIAALIYEDSANEEVLEKAVRIVIMMIVLVFDPLAVLMLIAANWQMRKDKEDKENQTDKPDAWVVDVDEKPSLEELKEESDEPAKVSSWSEQLFKKQDPLPDEAKSIIHKFFHKEDVKVQDDAKVEVVPPDTIVQEVDNLQHTKGVEYDSAGRRITP